MRSRLKWAKLILGLGFTAFFAWLLMNPGYIVVFLFIALLTYPVWSYFVLGEEAKKELVKTRRTGVITGAVIGAESGAYYAKKHRKCGVNPLPHPHFSTFHFCYYARSESSRRREHPLRPPCL